MKKIISNEYFWLTIIIIIAAFFRLYNLTILPPGLYPDEAMNGNNALEALDTNNFKIFYPENNGREGFFINIQAIFVKFLSNYSWALRLPSALFGLFTILGIYFLGRELFKNKYIGLLSSFFAATSFWHINFSRIGFRAIMAPFFFVWGIYFLLASFNKIKEQKSSKLYILYSAIAGIFYGLGFHSYIAYRATPLIILIILLLYWFQNKENLFRKKFLFSAFCFLFFTTIVAGPIGLYFLQNPQDFMGRTTQISIFNSPTPIKDLTINVLKTVGMFNFVGDYNWRHNYAGRPELFWLVGILFLMGIIYGIYCLFKKNKSFTEEKSPFIILFSLFIVAMMPVIISNEGLPHALRAILMAPAVFILAGFGGVWLIEKIKSQISKIKNTIQNSKIINFIIYASLIIIFSLLIFQTYYSYFIEWAGNSNVQGAFAADYAAIAKEINSLPKERPKYVIVEANGVDVRGLPMPTQTIMFLTDTFTPEKQKEKNIYYVRPDKIEEIPESSYKTTLK